jgi:hypothetical protein
VTRKNRGLADARVGSARDAATRMTLNPSSDAPERGWNLWRVTVLASCTAAAVGSVVLVIFARQAFGSWPWEGGNYSDSLKWYDITRSTIASVGLLGLGGGALIAYRRQRTTEALYALERSRRLDATTADLHVRYMRAAEQLGSEQAAVRLAGVYTMGALADDWLRLGSPVQQQVCIDVLCAYLRMPYDPLHPGSEVNRERQVRHTIMTVIRDHLQDPSSSDTWCHCDFDFTGVTFDGGSFNGARFIDGTVSFNGSQFKKDTVFFEKTEFRGPKTTFYDLRFQGGDASFYEARFVDGSLNFGGLEITSGRLSFYGAQFINMDVEFEGSRLNGGRLSFRSADVQGGTVNLHQASILGCEVAFDNSSLVGGRVRFDDVTLASGRISFRSTSFSGGQVLFTNTSLAGGNLSFDGTVFNCGLLDLSGIRLAGGHVEFLNIQGSSHSLVLLQRGMMSAEKGVAGPWDSGQIPSWVRIVEHDERE